MVFISGGNLVQGKKVFAVLPPALPVVLPPAALEFNPLLLTIVSRSASICAILSAVVAATGELGAAALRAAIHLFKC